MTREAGHRYIESYTLRGLGVVHAELRRFEEASEYLRQALAIHRETGDRHGEAWGLYHLSFVLQRSQGRDAARDRLQEALAIFTELGAPEAHDVRALLEE
jgi:tetratricopeptide (TPR) repeat protein